MWRRALALGLAEHSGGSLGRSAGRAGGAQGARGGTLVTGETNILRPRTRPGTANDRQGGQSAHLAPRTPPARGTTHQVYHGVDS